ncbi:MAG: two-component system response regulator RpfG [Gallionellaceae bacterium]|nr:MAG: two-component system response regulator RpfG [Gallionellaceae bacterium]
MLFEVIDHEISLAQMPTVVIIDDEFTSRAILGKVLQGVQKGIHLQTFAEPVAAMAWLRENQADLITVDYVMSGMTGLEVVQQIRRISSLKDVPVVVVTSMEERNIRYQALEAGATDFITKPIDPYECGVRCRNMLSLRLQQKIILDRSLYLEKAISDATEQIRQRELETILKLAKAGEYRDELTGDHIVRMAKYSRLIAEALCLPEEKCGLIEVAAPMHDIGKIGIPDTILLKQGKLTLEEFEVMKGHPRIGFQILQHSPSKYLSLGAEIALAHHEKYDGSGYPDGLAGEAIPLEARVVAVADVYDALTTSRPYKNAWPIEEALAYLEKNKRAHFDPDCVDAFIAQFDKVLLVQQRTGLAEPQLELVL